MTYCAQCLGSAIEESKRIPKQMSPVSTAICVECGGVRQTESDEM
jgi:hypothetical protein